MSAERHDNTPAERREAKSSSLRGVLGRKGEDLAAQHLESLGFTIIERNWRSPRTRNELDLVALDGETVVFVEVKTARTKTFGDPLGWITSRKRAAIVMAARAFLAGWHKTGSDFRFDAVTVGPPDKHGQWVVHHLPGAFTWDEP